MKKLVLLAAVLSAFSVPLLADNWLIGGGSGAFVFGDFAESERVLGTPEQVIRVKSSLSAATRPGARLDIERLFNDRFSLRAETTFTRTKLAVKTTTRGREEEGVSLDVGHLNVTTIGLPVVWRVNRGTFRVQLYAGPAYAIYDMDRDVESGEVPLFNESRGRIGAVAGAGLEWWLNRRWAIRGTLSDIYTDSPLERTDFERTPPPNLEIGNTHNVQTLVGAVYRF
jgi:hypothetical protein